MISMGTQVFQRIIEEAKQGAKADGVQSARSAGVKALTDTMHQETDRFKTFSREHVASCAEDRFDYYLNYPDQANCGNQVFPR